MNDTFYIEEVRERIKFEEIENGNIPKHKITDNVILYRKYYGDSIHECVKELLK